MGKIKITMVLDELLKALHGKTISKQANWLIALWYTCNLKQGTITEQPATQWIHAVF